MIKKIQELQREFTTEVPSLDEIVADGITGVYHNLLMAKRDLDNEKVFPSDYTTQFQGKPHDNPQP